MNAAPNVYNINSALKHWVVIFIKRVHIFTIGKFYLTLKEKKNGNNKILSQFSVTGFIKG